MQIAKILGFEYKPSERDLANKILEIAHKVNILIEDRNYIDRYEI